MKYCDHHGGGSEDVIQEFDSPFGLGEYLRKYLGCWYVPVTFDNLKAEKYTDNGDPGRGWKELWIVTVEDFGVCGWADSWFKEKE